MTQRTTRITLTTDWAEISAGGETVLVSVPQTNQATVEVAVGLLADYVAGEAGHSLNPTGTPSASFYALSGNRVLARKMSGDVAAVVVTEY